MKTLQNNFTTPEQSKRLLELGVPADSADCMNFGNADIFQIPFQRPFSEHLKRHVQDGLKKMYTPCWSVGRLIEIVLKTPGFPYLCSEPTISLTNHNINRIIDLIIETIEVNLDVVDFSKLEDNYEHS